jgi:acylphosphatase
LLLSKSVCHRHKNTLRVCSDEVKIFSYLYSIANLHYNIHIKGKVQGVAFRFTAQAKAIQLGLTGMVKNLPDGSVFIEAEGKEEAINSLIEWWYVGPPRSRVMEVNANESDYKGYTTFELKRL